MAEAIVSAKGNACERSGSYITKTMKTFYNVTLFCFALGMIILFCYAPWTPTPVGSPYTHVALGYAPVWSAKFAGVPGARVDWGGFT
jgi:hypothetical protein